MFKTQTLTLRSWTAAMVCAFGAAPTASFAQEDGETPTVVFEAVYTGELVENTRGGLARGDRYLDNLDVVATVDMEKAVGLDDGTLFLYGLYNNGNSLSGDLVGDAQTVSNLEAVEAIRLYEAWYEQHFMERRGSLRVGLYDVNSEFDAIDTAGLFVLSSHGIGPDFAQSGLNGPSIFPVTSLAARLQFQVNDNWLVRAAVLDGVPGDPAHPSRTAIHLGNGDGALLVGEVETTFGDTIASVGVWGYTAQFDHLIELDPSGAPRRRGGNVGAYVEAEHKLYSPHNDDRGLWAFARYGIAEAEINQHGAYLGFGAAYQGLIDGRPDDILGLAFAHARNGKTFRRAQALAGAPVEKHETNIELTYRAQLTPWLAVQPDAQWVINPGTDPTLRNALVVGFRFEVGFGKEF